MARFEQYELWTLQGESWEPAAMFPDFDVAWALMCNYSRGASLMHVIYQDGQAVEKEVLARLGNTRQQP